MSFHTFLTPKRKLSEETTENQGLWGPGGDYSGNKSVGNKMISRDVNFKVVDTLNGRQPSGTKWLTAK